LQVILHVDRKLPMVHVNSWFHAGSKNESNGARFLDVHRRLTV
jgi:hypothetical protein